MVQKILIIRFSSIGDIVLTTPIMRCLKKQFPEIEIHYLTKPEYKILLENNPNIDKIHVLDKSIFEKALELKAEKFDAVIDLHKNLRTLIFKTLLEVNSYSYNKLNFEKWLFVNLKINRLPKIHIVDRYFEAANAFCNSTLINDGEGLDYFFPENVWTFENLPQPMPENFIAWAIGAQHFTKKLPNEKIIRICQKLTIPVFILGGKEDFENGEQISNAAGVYVKNLCGKLNISQSASVIFQSKLLATNDTGMMHIGAALKKPILSIWGNTIPEFGMSAYFGNKEIRDFQFAIQNLHCRPCSKIGFNKCPKTHFKCMNLQNEDEILKTIQQFLN